ncbi:MAG: flagellar basal-body rod protein FlgG [Planctomycetota bacterium]|nr:MAG: flagellar basal-body rod protein FlgG [Planctomycetota bacterium]
MLRALWSGATGMKAQSQNIDVIANNLANVNTTGFKKSKALFSDLQYEQIKAAGLNTTADTINPTGIEIGLGVKNSSVIKIFTQGTPEITDRPLDLVIEGEGFFKVVQGGQDFYTRNGAFTLNDQGIITTAEGYELDGAFTVGAEAKNINIGVDGTITSSDGLGVTTEIGRIQLHQFRNPAGLTSKGRSLYIATNASGVPVAVNPSENGESSILNGSLELSNVQAVEEMVGMIKAQRAYELNSRSITTADQMLQEVNNLKR